MNLPAKPTPRVVWPLWAALAGALVGIAILAAWFGKAWPATSWTVLPRSQLIAKGRQVSEHFGLNTDGWKAVAVADVSKSLAAYKQRRPENAGAQEVSPLSLRIKFSANQGERQAQVRLDSAGLPIYWHAPGGFKPNQKFASADAAANEAFRFLAGAQAAAFGRANRSSGDEFHEEEYVWKKPPAPHSEARERIKVVTEDSTVKSAERTVSLSSNNDDEDSDTGSNKGYWDVLDVAFGFTCTTAMIVIVGIYVLWLARRSVSHKFAIRIAAAALAVMFAASIAEGGVADAIFGALFVSALILCIVMVGRGISAAARPKWMSLEQLCLRAPVAKSAGDSLVAGTLFSPLLVAIPFFIAGCGLFPQSFVLARHVDVLYGRQPLLDSISIPADAYLLGFFGFGIPALQRMLRARWLSWTVISLIGTFFFADQSPVVTGPVAAPLSAGLCTLALFWFVYAYFDLLAVLTLQVAGAWVLSLLMLGQKGGEIWTLLAALGCLFIAAYWLVRRGQPISEGDPLATIPALADFRAEREKLKAEFSVARRAQQDMLPRIPPSLAGYSIAASCTPSLEVGGDLYDFLKLPDGRIGIGVADVSGKGVPAALYMTLTKGLLASITKSNSKLASVVEEVNRHLHGVTRKKVFVTMALGFLDLEKRILECVRAGHNPVVWRQASRNLTTLVTPGGLGLGITASRVFSTQLKVAEMALSEGDAVVFYSDGITEAMNSGLEQFGEQRLMDAVEKADSLDAAAARDSILGEVRDFLGGVHPQDDMTLVVLRVEAK